MAGVLASAGTVVVLALKLSEERQRGTTIAMKLHDSEQANAAAGLRADRAAADLEDYRQRAQAELRMLRVEIEELSNAQHIVDPVARRARWGRLLSRTDEAIAELDRDDSATDGGLLPGLDDGKPATDGAGGGAAGPGELGPAT